MSGTRWSPPWWARLGAGAILLAAVLVVLHVLGVAGYRVGWLWAAIPLSAAVVTGARLLGRAFPGRPAWIAAFTLIAVVGLAWLVDHAPMSGGRLAAQLDRLEPAFLTQRSQQTMGHSWCRPTCPSVTRTYRAPTVGAFGTLLNVAAELRLEGLLPNLVAVGQNRPSHYLRVYGERYTVTAEVVRRGNDTTLTLRIAARRARIHHIPKPQMAAATSRARTRSFFTSISALTRRPFALGGTLTPLPTRRTVPSLNTKSLPSIALSSPV